MARADSRRPFTMETRVLSQGRLVVNKVALGQVFLRVLRVFPGNIIAPYLHLHVLLPEGQTNEAWEPAYIAVETGGGSRYKLPGPGA